MRRARKQAERYAQAIPGEWPPFLIVVDVGHCIQLYADFTQSGKNYQPFPDPASFQIWLPDLEQKDIRDHCGPSGSTRCRSTRPASRPR